MREIAATGLPLVLFSRHVEAGIDSVGPDNFGGMRLAMEHLIELGHRRIALVGANERNSTGTERLAGYLKALTVARLPANRSLVKFCAPSRDEGFRAVQELMQLAAPPTAIACFNDVLAFGVMLGLRDLKMVPGQDVSVIGFDDIAEAGLWRPRLTTIAIPRRELAVEAGDLLNSRIANKSSASAGRTLVQTKLIVRETTSKAP